MAQIKNLFKLDSNSHHHQNSHRLSEPTFRHPNFSTAASRSDSTDTTTTATVCGNEREISTGPMNYYKNRQAGSQNNNNCINNKAASLDYRSNYSNAATNNNLTGAAAAAAAGSSATSGVKKVKCVFLGDAKVGKTSLIVSYTTNGYPKDYTPTAFDNFSVLVKVDNKPVQLQLCDTAGQIGFDNLRPLCYPNADVFVLCFSVVDPDSFYNLHNKWLPEIRGFLDEQEQNRKNLAAGVNGNPSSSASPEKLPSSPPPPSASSKSTPSKGGCSGGGSSKNDVIATNSAAAVTSSLLASSSSATNQNSPALLLVGTQSDRRTNVSTILDLSQCGETVIQKSEAEEYRAEIGALRYVECSALTQHNLKDVFDACILAALKMPLTCDEPGNSSGGRKYQKSKIEKAKSNNYYANCAEFNSSNSSCTRKSFKKLKEKMKRSNSVDSTKYTSVQVRRQLSSGRINQVGLSNSINQAELCQKLMNQQTSTANHANCHQKPDYLKKTKNEKSTNTCDSALSKKFCTAAAAAAANGGVQKKCAKMDSANHSSLQNSPSHSKLVTFSWKNANFISKNGRKMSSKSFDNFTTSGANNSTPKLSSKITKTTTTTITTTNSTNKFHKSATKSDNTNNNNNNNNNNNSQNNSLDDDNGGSLQDDIDRLKKGWRKLLCMA